MYIDKVAAVQATTRWRLVGLPLIIGFIVLMVIPSASTLIFSQFLPGTINDAISVSSAAGMWVGLVGGGYLMIRVSKITWTQLGFEPHNWLRNCFIGIALGAGLLTIVAVIIRLLGATTWEWAFNSGAISGIVVAAVFFIAQGTWEELIYRGYLMPHLSKAWNDTAAIIVTSLLFTAGHAFNPGMTFMPILNLVIFGFVFALLYWRTGNLWITGLAHSAWNFCQGFVFGSEVSGNPAESTFIRSTATAGRDLLSGGSFGFEGSIITSLAGLVLIGFMIWGWPAVERKTK